MQLKIVSTLIVGLFISFNLYAEEVLCTISSDIDSSIAKLTYEMDQDTQTITHMYQEKYENNQMTDREEIKVEGLTAGGMILLAKGKLTVVRIWSDNFDKNLGGVLYLDTLYSGVSGERRQYEIDLAKNKTGLVLSNNKNDFTNMQFIANRSRMFGIIGIAKINFSK